MKHLAARLGSLMLPIAMSMNMVACGGDGKDGATGEQGEQGDQGKQGDQGEQGDRGPKGDPGKPGADGTDGTDGTDGADGADGAEGPAGADGADGQDGISTAVLSGSVTNGSDDSTLAGAVLSFDPASPDGDVAADDDGAYTVTLPIGVYTVTATADGFTEQAQTVSLVAGNDVALDIELVPESPVAIAAEGATGEPGATVSLSASATVYDGSTGTEYSWEQISGPPVTISGEDTATPDVTLPSAATSIEAIIESLQVPDRLMVLGVLRSGG